MRVLILADARAGHLRQSRGLAGLIARMQPADIVEIPLVPRKFAFERVRWGVSWLRTMPPAGLLERFYSLAAETVSGFDVVIGSGRPTILAGILIARATGAKFVYCGRVAGYDTRDIALVLVPYAADAGLPRHALAPIPSPIEPERWSPPRPLASMADLEGAEMTLLVGGPSSSRSWTFAEWLQLSYFILASGSALKLRWSIATSRRTPDVARDLLASTFAALEQRGNWVDFSTEGPGSADALLGADAICVTSDSTSMIAEGLAAMRPVIGIGSHRLKRSRDDGLLSMLAGQGSFAEVPLAGITPDLFAAAALRLTPPTEDPRDTLMAALRPVLAGTKAR